MIPFRLWKTIVPVDQINFPQQFGLDVSTGDLYLTQAEDSGFGYENLTISRFIDTTYVARMTGLQGHGTPLRVENVNGTTYLTFPYRGASGGDQWIRLPFVADKQWTAAEALTYRTAPLPTHMPPATRWMQGEVVFEDAVFRLVGGPFKVGQTLTDGEPARLDVIRGGRIVRTVDAAMLGRVGLSPSGAPINDRLEPEGLALWYSNMAPHLVIGIANGRADMSSLALRLYFYPLDGADFIRSSLPASMQVGTSVPISITMRNTGESTWKPSLHQLGEMQRIDVGAPLDPLNPDSTIQLTETFYDLVHPVPPGSEVTFTYPLRAIYPMPEFQWQMVRDPWQYRHYFGSPSPRANIPIFF